MCTYTGTPTLGAGGVAALSALIHGGQEGLHTEFFPPLQSSEEAFSGTVDSLVQENFSGVSPQILKVPMYY